MSAIARKTIRTSTTILEYPAPSPARKVFDSCVTWAIVGMLALGAGAVIYFVSNLW